MSRSRVSTMASALSSQMSGQMEGWPAAIRVMSRKPPGGQLQQGGVLLAQAGGQVHQGGRGQVGHVGDHRHQGVVLGRVPGRPRWPRGRRARCAPGRRRPGRSTSVGVRTQVAPTNSSPEAPSSPTCSRAGHGVAADEAGVVDGGHQRPLHAADVGDHGLSGSSAGEARTPAMISPAAWTGRGHHHQVGLVVDALLGQGAELDGPGGHPVGGVRPRSPTSRGRAAPSPPIRR